MRTWRQNTRRGIAAWELVTVGLVILVMDAVLVLLLIGLSGSASASGPYPCRTYAYSGESFTSCSWDDDGGHHYSVTTCSPRGCIYRQDS